MEGLPFAEGPAARDESSRPLLSEHMWIEGEHEQKADFSVAISQPEEDLELSETNVLSDLTKIANAADNENENEFQTVSDATIDRDALMEGPRGPTTGFDRGTDLEYDSEIASSKNSSDAKANKKLVTIRIRPMDGDWVMGDDEEMTVPFDLSITNLKLLIEAERGIHHERGLVIHPRTKKPIEKLRESWGLRRHGIGNKDVVILVPTFPGGWTWNGLQYYQDKMINEIISEVLLTGPYVRLDELERKVKKPPCIQESMLVVARQYPDKLHVRYELSSDRYMVGISMIGQSAAFYESNIVHVPKELMLFPSFEAGSVLAGTKNPPVNTFDFDWDAYEDLDSIGFDVGAIVMPDTIYRISIFSAFACRPDLDVFLPTNPFVDVHWNGKRTALTPVRFATFRPSWMDTVVRLRQSSKTDILNCHLRLSLFSFRDSGTCFLLGTVEFDGKELKDLFSPQIDARIEELSLQLFEPSESVKAGGLAGSPRGAEDDNDVAYNADIISAEAAKVDKDFDYDALISKSGTFSPALAKIKLAVLHSEFEIRVHFCQALVNQEGTDISPFVIVIFNGRDIGMTDVKAQENSPVWPNPTSYSLKIGTLDMFECSLNIEVWQMGSTGRENLLGQVVYAGKAFVDLVAECSSNYVRHLKDLTMPIIRNKDAKAAAAATGKAKKKVTSNFGKICFDVGPVGMPPPRQLVFEVSIVSAVMLPVDNVFCQVYWNHVSIGDTQKAIYTDPNSAEKEGAEPVGGAGANEAPWKWEANLFTFACSDEEAVKNSSLKVYLCDAGDGHKTKTGVAPAVVRYGCLSFTGEALLDFLKSENSFAQSSSFDFQKDPDETRLQKPPRGSMILRRGPRGARLESERTIVVHSCKLKLTDLKMGGKINKFSGSGAENPSNTLCFFFTAYFDGAPIGSGPVCIVKDNLNPFWEESWFHLPVNDKPLKECSLKLELMMYKIMTEDSPDNASALEGSNSAAVRSAKDSSSAKRGGGTQEMLHPGEGLPFAVAVLNLNGNDLKAVVGSKLTTRMEKQLEPAASAPSKAKKPDKYNTKPDPLKTHQLDSGLVLVGSPGTAVSSYLDIVKKHSDQLTEKYSEYTSRLDLGLESGEADEKEGDMDHTKQEEEEQAGEEQKGADEQVPSQLHGGPPATNADDAENKDEGDRPTAPSSSVLAPPDDQEEKGDYASEGNDGGS